MEFLVTMTTVVPDGTAPEAVDDVRTREAARTAQLASAGELLRLWRPPLQPGEWRTLGLFAAPDGDALEAALASMPLRVWRTDEVTPLVSHPNDPERADTDGGGAEFFVTFTTSVPGDTPRADAERAFAQEATRARELAAEGHLQRLWRLPAPESADASRSLGLWRARDAPEMQRIVDSLPLLPWMAVDVVPLTPHPSDPATAAVGVRPQPAANP
jgi:muconolactone delta-isomerase